MRKKRNAILIPLLGATICIVAALGFQRWARATRGVTQSPKAEPSARNSTEPPTSDVSAGRFVVRPPRQPLSAEKEAQLQVEGLTLSGPSSEASLPNVENLGKTWLRLAAQNHFKITLSDWKCYRLGCYVTMSTSKAGDVDKLTSKLTSAPEFGVWPGGKFRSGVMTQPDGTVRVTWIFFSRET
jgi:hypothetical protein